MENYNLPGHEAVTARWDDMQRDLGCCGGKGWNNGYSTWSSTGKAWGGDLTTREGGMGDKVPDSCCKKISDKNCGSLKEDPNEDHDFYIDGCMEVLEQKLERDVLPMMTGYAVFGGVLAFVEVVTIVLSCVYVAQIGRRLKAEAF